MKIKKVILLLFFLSGICGLIYEIVWVRMLALIFGNTSYAIATVLASFMGGLAFGSWLLGKLIDKIGNRNIKINNYELITYALVELSIGLYCVLTPSIFTLVKKIFLQIVTVEVTVWSLFVLFIFAFIVVFIPTTLMGGTLPIIIKYFMNKERKHIDGEKYSFNIGILYSVNTWGAVIGSLLTGYILIRFLGVKHTLYFAVFINIIIAVTTYILSMLHKTQGKQDTESYVTPKEKSWENSKYDGNNKTIKLRSNLILLIVGIFGFSALSYEVIWTRIFSMIIGSTVYAFSIILCAFLSGIALGSLIYTKLYKRVKNNKNDTDKTGIRKDFGLLGFVQASIGVCALLLISAFGILPLLFLKIYKYFGFNYDVFHIFQFLMIFVIMVLPTTLFGIALPFACKIYANVKSVVSQKLISGTGVFTGNVYAANTIGAILGSIIAGFILIPLIGMSKAIMLVSMVNIGTSIILISFGLKEKRWARNFIIYLLIFFSIPYVLAVPSWNIANIMKGVYISPQRFFDSDGNIRKDKDMEFVYYNEGAFSTIGIERRNNYKYLISDGRIVASTEFEDMRLQKILGHLPLLIHNDPKDILVIGMGAAITLGVNRLYPVKKIDCVEIEKNTSEAAQYFNAENNDILNDPRLNIIFNDGRNWLSRNNLKYDVISCDPFHPFHSGSSHLFSEEYFTICKDSLDEDGIFAQWLPLYFVSSDDIKMILKTFLKVFPYGNLWFTATDVVLIGSKTEISLDYNKFKRKFSNQAVKEDLIKVGISNPEELFSCYVADRDTLLIYSKNALINNDNHPRLEFSAPKGLNSRFSTILNLCSILLLRRSPSVENIDKSIIEKYFKVKTNIIKGQISMRQLKFKKAMQYLGDAENLVSGNKEAEHYIYQTLAYWHEVKTSEKVGEFDKNEN